MDTFSNTGYMTFAYIPVILPFAYQDGLYWDYPLNRSEQEAVDRVKDHLDSTELKKFIKGLRV